MVEIIFYPAYCVSASPEMEEDLKQEIILDTELPVVNETNETEEITEIEVNETDETVEEENQTFLDWIIDWFRGLFT